MLGTVLQPSTSSKVSTAYQARYPVFLYKSVQLQMFWIKILKTGEGARDESTQPTAVVDHQPSIRFNWDYVDLLHHLLTVQFSGYISSANAKAFLFSEICCDSSVK